MQFGDHRHREHAALLERFGGQLPQALGALSPDQVMGLWPGGMAARPVAPVFEPQLYGLDHAHPHPEMCLLLAGQCRLKMGPWVDREKSVEGTTVALRRGDFVVIPGGIAHAESSSESEENYSLAWWILPPAQPHLQVTEYSQSGGFAVMHRVVLDTFSAEILVRLDQLAAMASQAEKPLLYPMKEALLSVALAVLRRALEGGEDLDQRPQAVALALEYIERHLHRPLDLAEVGRAVLLSPNYLTALCKRHTGESLGSLIKRRRIERSKRLLREHPELQVKQVAAAVGFDDPYSFSRAFRTQEGHSPSAFREGVRLAGRL